MYQPTEQLEEQEYNYTDDQLVQLVMDEVRRSDGSSNSSIDHQRERAYKHYAGEPFGNERAGFSRHVSRDVFEAVEDIKAELLNTFCSGPQVLRFTEEADNDQEGARDATDYVHSVFYDQNRGYDVLFDVIHDGLLAKLGAVKRCYYSRIRAQKQLFADVPAEALQALLGQQNVADFEITSERTERIMVPTEMGPAPQEVHLVSGSITTREEVGELKVESIAPENVLFPSNATSVNDSDIVVIKYPDKLIGELAAEGYDPELLEGLSRVHSRLDTAAQARRSFDRSFDIRDRDGKDERSTIDLYEAYAGIDMDGDGVPEWWKITVAGNKLIDKEEVSEKPLRFWEPYRIPHKAIGMSVDDIVGDIQRTNSGIVRGIVDNIYLTNTSMKIADLSLVRNPRDLIDNPIGVVIDSPDPQAVQMVPQPQLNPATFEAMGILLEQKSGRTGLNKLPAQQVVSHQNSEDMINMLMAEGQKRIAMMARGFAESFLKPLFIDIYRLGVEYGHVVGAETDTGYRVLDPNTFLPVRTRMKVAVALTSDERMKRAQALMTTYETIRNDEQMMPLFGVEEKFNLLTDFFEAMGTGSPRYLKNPNTPEGQQAIKVAMQQAEEAAQMQQQLLMQQLELAQGDLQIRMQKTMAQVHEIMEKLRLVEEKQTAEGLIEGRKQALAEDRFEWNQDIAEEELKLEREQGRNVVIRSGGAS